MDGAKFFGATYSLSSLFRHNLSLIHSSIRFPLRECHSCDVSYCWSGMAKSDAKEGSAFWKSLPIPPGCSFEQWESDWKAYDRGLSSAGESSSATASAAATAANLPPLPSSQLVQIQTCATDRWYNWCIDLLLKGMPAAVDEKEFFCVLGKADAIYSALQKKHPADKLPGRNPFLIIREMTDVLVDPQRKQWMYMVKFACDKLVALSSKPESHGFLRDVRDCGWQFELQYYWLMRDERNAKVNRAALYAIWCGTNDGPAVKDMKSRCSSALK